MKNCKQWYLVQFLIFLVFSWVYASGKDIKFQHITIDNGLSQNTVYCILQDKDGFMWFGTQDGLNRFDGYQFKLYRHEQDDSNSISNKYIVSIHETRLGVLWIGTQNGLNKLDRNIDGFKKFFYNPQNHNSLSHNFVTSIYEDKTGRLWIGTKDGLNRYNSESKHFTRYYHSNQKSNSLSSNKITTVFQGQSGTLWIGTENGLNQYHSGVEDFTRYFHDPKNPHTLSNNHVTSIYQDRSGILWIGTEDGLNQFNQNTGYFTSYFNKLGNHNSLSNNHVLSIYEDNSGILWIGTTNQLNQLDRSSNSFIRYKTNPGDRAGLNNNYILSIYQDRSGMLWLGTYGGGLNTFDGTVKYFIHYRAIADKSNSLNNNDILSFYEDKQGMLWIGTHGGGLNRLNLSSGQFRFYQNDPGDLYSLSNDYVRAICEDHKGTLWIGTDGSGINKFDRKTEKFIRYQKDNSDIHSINSNIIRSICEDSYNNLWIATFGGGLNRFDRDSENFHHFKYDSNDTTSLSYDDVYVVHEDRSGVLWIGTYGKGLNKLINNKEKILNPRFVSYKHNPDNSNNLSNNFIMSICDDQSGMLWIGTHNGLNKFNPNEETFQVYTVKDGLPNNMIYGILEDNQRNIWVTTNKGLSKFNPKTETFKNYDVSNGLQSNEFWGGSYFKNKKGELFFGGVNGFNVFYPDSVKENSYIPPVVITDLQIFNKPVSIGEEVNGRVILEKSILKTDKIKLSYKERSFSFEFAALNYISPEGNEYKYKMEGFEKKWNYIGNRRFATYTSLPPDHYTFQVIGSNNDGIWNQEGTSLKITITPPFWQTWWFRALIVIFVVGVAFSWYKMRVRNLEKQKQKLEIQVKERTTEIRYKNKQLKEKNNQIQDKNEQILSSIRYGERIQNAILPLTEKIRSSLPQHFIFYKPRDIVSGDFYWFNQIDGKIVLAVVDCTGHGVPGAFMSMLGNAFLNQIVTEQKILNPPLILTRFHEEVRAALKQEQNNINTQDGMDVCLCVLEKNSHTQKLVFAGAKCSLYIIKKGETELIEIKGDRKSIGGKQREKKRVFTGHELKVRKGDRLYLTTDGFADQQNSKNRRYGSRRLKAFLQSGSELEMQEQEKALAQELARHQGKEEQRDDITVVGVRV